jgi:hypothetical protein
MADDNPLVCEYDEDDPLEDNSDDEVALTADPLKDSEQLDRKRSILFILIL